MLTYGNNGNNESAEIEFVEDSICMGDRSHAWMIHDGCSRLNLDRIYSTVRPCPSPHLATARSQGQRPWDGLQDHLASASHGEVLPGGRHSVGFGHRVDVL
jgi:hypothetical protein